MAAAATAGGATADDGAFERLLKSLVKEERLTAYAGGDFLTVLSSSPQSRQILQNSSVNNVSSSSSADSWPSQISSTVSNVLQTDKNVIGEVVLLSAACLDAFLQSNVTGPPLTWRPSKELLPAHLQSGTEHEELHRALTARLSVDGEAVYSRIAHVELFILAKELSAQAAAAATGSEIASSSSPPPPSSSLPSRWLRFRVNCWHQRLLSEVAPSLQKTIREDADFLQASFSSNSSTFPAELRASFLLEQASARILHGEDKRARDDLDEAAKINGFQHVLTGRLGKRTKFQTFDTSQLVVLAKSGGGGGDTANSGGKSKESVVDAKDEPNKSRPENLDLNDDTLLEKISFTPDSRDQTSDSAAADDDDGGAKLPEALQGIDAGNQPILQPLDSINLLLLASSITNTSPDHGLTREETLPYAVRVLEGGSSNWQIYSQALLVRSRIEAHKSRTVERGVLQMQALVDQVIAETTTTAAAAAAGDAAPDNNYQNGSTDDDNKSNGGAAGGESSSAVAPATTFIPRPKPSESAPASERLRYIHALASPTRWSLEAELAERWVSVGGLKTALEIYERLEMWAETALCYASLEEDKKARDVVTRQLYEDDSATRKEKTALPNDAPRLFCILGDIDDDADMYERAWEVSNKRYAKAQRSLGRFHLKKRELSRADRAYSLSLAINPQNSSSWFSLGCIKLELREWKGAAEAFGRVVQREQDDAEAWSNLAAALLRLPAAEGEEEEEEEEEEEAEKATKDEEQTTATPKTTGPISPPPPPPPPQQQQQQPAPASDPQKHAKQAFVAFKRAANLKRDNHRIWRNVLNVAATLSPPPYNDIIQAQTRIIELRGPTEGEESVDVEVLEGLLNHVVQNSREREALHVDATASNTEENIEENIEENKVVQAGVSHLSSSSGSRRVGLERMFVELMTRKVQPLITHSPRLWRLVAKLSIFLDRPSAALDAYEKAWRATLNQPGWDGESEPSSGGGGDDKGAAENKSATSADEVWRSVVDATIELVDAYESLGEREVTEGLKAGSGELVCRSWRQKSRMAIRSVTGRRTRAGKDDDGDEMLEKLRGARGRGR